MEYLKQIFNLHDKVAVLTGGGGVLAAGMAEGFSKSEAKVVLLDINQDGSITSKFDSVAFRAFDLFILKRDVAEDEYSREQINEAKYYLENLSDSKKDELIATVLYGLPGSLEAYSIDEFRNALKEYNEVGDSGLRNNLYEFIKEITPTAEEHDIRLGIHPDDPPWSLLGLPRIVSTKQDLSNIINASFSPSNGITFCTGSLGASINNDIVNMTKTFSERINFLHLRNIRRNNNGDFIETYHLEGEIDLPCVVKILLLEQKSRQENGRKDFRIPMRPDHGHLMIPEFEKEGIYPGYSLMGRMRGLAELRGLELGILNSIMIN